MLHLKKTSSKCSLLTGIHATVQVIGIILDNILSRLANLVSNRLLLKTKTLWWQCRRLTRSHTHMYLHLGFRLNFILKGRRTKFEQAKRALQVSST